MPLTRYNRIKVFNKKEAEKHLENRGVERTFVEFKFKWWNDYLLIRAPGFAFVLSILGVEWKTRINKFQSTRRCKFALSAAAKPFSYPFFLKHCIDGKHRFKDNLVVECVKSIHCLRNLLSMKVEKSIPPIKYLRGLQRNPQIPSCQMMIEKSSVHICVMQFTSQTSTNWQIPGDWGK